MAKFEAGDRVKCTFDPDNKDDPWNGVGTVERSRVRDLTKVRLDSGTFAHLTDSEMTLVVETFQPGDIVRAEKGDAIAQDALRTIGSIETLWLREWRLSDYEEKGYTLTLIKRPEPEIVLPTNRYALIEIDSWLYIRGFGGAWSTIGNFARVSHSTMETRARKSGFYRVIFEGENE